MVSTTVSELKMNLSHYLELSQKQEVAVTKNGKLIARISGVLPDKKRAARALIGILPTSIDYDALREERILS